MPETDDARHDPYLDRLDRWIAETREFASRTTNSETLKHAEDDLRRWMDERTRHTRAVRWYGSLDRSAGILLRVLGGSVGLLVFSALLQKSLGKPALAAIAISFVVVIGSGFFYLVVTLSRDAVAQGKQIWKFSLRLLLVITTILAIVLGLFAFLVRI